MGVMVTANPCQEPHLSPFPHFQPLSSFPSVPVLPHLHQHPPDTLVLLGLSVLLPAWLGAVPSPSPVPHSFTFLVCES